MVIMKLKTKIKRRNQQRRRFYQLKVIRIIAKVEYQPLSTLNKVP